MGSRFCHRLWVESQSERELCRFSESGFRAHWRNQSSVGSDSGFLQRRTFWELVPGGLFSGNGWRHPGKSCFGSLGTWLWSVLPLCSVQPVQHLWAFLWHLPSYLGSEVRVGFGTQRVREPLLSIAWPDFRNHRSLWGVACPCWNQEGQTKLLLFKSLITNLGKPN